MKQFDDLKECDLEAAFNQRYPSGRRHCVILDVPCGISDPDNCKIKERMK